MSLLSRLAVTAARAYGKFAAGGVPVTVSADYLVVAGGGAGSSYYGDRKSTRLNSSHSQQSRMPSSA